MASRSIVFIDVDGTLFDNFKEEDKTIIKEIFGNNIFINIIDSILWFINSFDFISNSIAILKLRFIIYSIFSFKSYRNICLLYEKLYKEKLNLRLKKIDKEKLEKFLIDYAVHIITNNPFSVDICIDYFNHVVFCKNNTDRKKNIKKIIDKSKSSIIVGNNFIDDILIAKKTASKSIYIGKSKIRKTFNADEYLLNFDDVFNIL